jgi:hypothetical protein
MLSDSEQETQVKNPKGAIDAERQKFALGPYTELASAFLRIDRHFLWALLAFASAPQILYLTLGEALHVHARTANLLNILVEVAILGLVAVRWIPSISGKRENSLLVATLYFFLWAFAFALLAAAPGLLFSGQFEGFDIAPTLVLALAFAMGLSIFLLFRFFFYFVPIFSGFFGRKDVLSLSAVMTRGRILLPVYVLIPPIAVVSLTGALAEALLFNVKGMLPDIVLALIGATQPILSAYLAIAVSITALPKDLHKRLGWSEEVPSRVHALCAWKLKWIARIFEFRRALALLVVSVLLWSGNLMRSESVAIGFTSHVEKIEIQDQLIRLDLHLRDTDEDLSRAVNPALFRLAGPKSEEFSKGPPKVILAGKALPLMASLPRKKELRLQLEFEVPRKASDIRSLKDLNLWYQSKRVELLDFATAVKTSK